MEKIKVRANDPEGYCVEDVFKVLAQHSPNLRALCVPKDYARPLNYPDPALLMLSAFTGGHSVVQRLRVDEDVTSYSVHVTSSMLIRYQVPTFFVSTELCEALLKTEAPNDMLFDEIKWPMPAMLFVLPEEFSLRYFGNLVPYVSVCCVEPMSVIRSPLIVDGIKTPDLEIHNAKPFFCSTMLSIENGYPMHYDSRCPMDRPIKDLIIDSPFAIYRKILPDEESGHTAEDDQRSVNRMTTLVVNLMLAMTNVPDLITRERILRPAKKQNGKVMRRALWKPNFLGERFRIVYEKPSIPAGHHRSPRAHWRVGHWRNQRHGQQRMLVKLIWIQPVFVGLKASSRE